MADDTLGTAKLSIVVDTSNLDTAINQAKRSVSGMSKQAQQDYNRLNSSEKRRVDNLIRQADLLGKTRQEQILYNASLRGTPTSILDELKAKFTAVGTASATATKQLNQYGISAGQQAAALRGVPAQLTDILVGLQGGQAPLTILFQQGGQLRDLFGGIAPAAKALGGAVAGLVNPFTLAAAAVGGLAYAYHEGAAETDAFNKALILSGNVSGKTAGDLSELAKSIADTGTTQGAASRVLTEIVTNGKIASSAYRDVAEAALDMQDITGQAADKTVAVFAKLADEPTKASAALNEQYHYLTASVYEQISALEERGRTDDAAALAQRTYAHALKQRASEVRAEMGSLESAWNSVAGAAKGAWDAMLNIGRPTPIAELRKQAAVLQKTVSDLQAGQGFDTNEGGAAFGGGSNRAAAALKKNAVEFAAVQQEIADREQAAANERSDALKQAANDENIAATARLDDLRKQFRSREELRQDEIAQIIKDAAKVGKTQKDVQALIDGVNAKYAQKSQPKGGGLGADEGRKLIDQLNQRISLTGELTEREKIQSQIEQGRIAFKTQADKDEALALADVLDLMREQNRAAKEALRLAALRKSLDATLGNDKQRYGDQEAAFGQGSREQERLRSQAGLYRDYERQLRQISRDTTDPAFLQQQTEALNQNLADRLVAQQDHYDRLDKLRGSWTLGFEHSYKDYLDGAQNYYGQAGDVFKSVTGGMEDAFAKFVATGKLDFKSLADSILADLARIAARQAIVGAIGSIVGALGSAAISSVGAGVSTTGNGAALGSTDGLSGSFGAVAGARASGGPTAPNSLYRVNEEGPELFSQGGRTYLMSGAGGGYVTPLKKSGDAAGAGSGPISISIVVNEGQATRQREGASTDMASRLADQVKTLVQTEIARSYRAGGAGWNGLNGRPAA